METDRVFYISDWRIDPPACLISQGDESVHLEPKVMDLLVYMSLNPDHVHTRDDLLEHVWSGMVVSDEALTNAIIKLRKAFNDDARHPRFIETLSKRGYRLIAPVSSTVTNEQANNQPVSDRALETTGKQPIITRKWFFTLASIFFIIIVAAIAAWFLDDRQETIQQASETPGLPLPDKPSIAVLPFINTGNEIEYSYFSDGITDDLITDLSSLSGLFVISRNSTFKYKGRSVDVKLVAKTLGVRYILEGSVRRIDERVRVNTRLVDGTSGEQLWAERYDGNLQDVFKLQDRINAKIISALALQLTEKDQAQLASSETSNPRAYDEFLRGWERHWRVTREDFAQAEIHFKKALELDPGFSRAHAALAFIYWQSWQQMWHFNSGSRGAGWVRARRELDSAMVHPTPLAHSLLSAMQLYNRRYEEAIMEAERAVSLDPNSATGYLALAEAQVFAGRPNDAIAAAKKAFRLDPNFPAPYLFAEALALFSSQHYEKAITLLQRAVSAKPEFNEALIVLIAAYGQLGRLNDASPVQERLNQRLVSGKLPRLTIDWQKHRWPYQHEADRNRLFEGLKKAGVPEW